MIAAIGGLVAGWAWEYGLVDFMQGPIAKATNNTDLSWLTEMLVAGVGYYVLRPFPREGGGTPDGTDRDVNQSAGV